MEITRSGNDGDFSYTVRGGFENHPVTHISFFDAMRFTNWLENGQTSSGTEDGVYRVGTTGFTESRAIGATYFLPTENEWYKAAFHDKTAPGEYWDYPTRSNTRPTAELPPGGANSENADNVVGGTTPVGAYRNSSSYYGTF